MAGQTIYVLTTLQGVEGKKANREWRPIGVVTSVDVADKWVASGNNNDWIPFELDDMQGLAQEGQYTPFKPTPATAPEQSNDAKAVEIAKRLEVSNQRLLKIIEQLQEQLKRKGR
jgi:hypothetical protein